MPRTRAQDRVLLRALRHGEPYHLFPMPLQDDADKAERLLHNLARRPEQVDNVKDLSHI